MERVSLVSSLQKTDVNKVKVGKSCRGRAAKTLVLCIAYGFLISSQMTRNEIMYSILKCCNTELKSEGTVHSSNS